MTNAPHTEYTYRFDEGSHSFVLATDNTIEISGDSYDWLASTTDSDQIARGSTPGEAISNLYKQLNQTNDND